MAALKVKKLAIGKGDSPGPQDYQNPSEPESLDPSPVDGPAQGKVPFTALFCRT